MRLRFGLAAWSNAHFDNALYPLGTKHDQHLPRYASLFPVAEADQLHHRMPSPALLKPWVEQTPEGFLFLPKMWKRVTHEAGTASDARTWLDALEPLRAAEKLGPILLQFPPSFKREAGWDRLRELLALEEPGTFAVEVRDASWFVPAFEAMLEDFAAILAWSTFPKSFAPPWATAGRGYVRFTGKHVAKRGRYVTQGDRRQDTLEVAKRLRQAPWKEAFVIVTNPFEGNAVDSMPRIAAALGETDLAERLKRPPGQVVFPDKGPKQATLGA